MAQRTIHVPADQGTIQAAINAASDGDTILVAPGVYPERIDFKGKAITVDGTDRYGDAQITGDGQGPSVSFVSGEGRNSLLTNITVEGGKASGTTEQAGVFIMNASPTLRNVQVFAAECHGVHAVNAAPLIDSSRIASTVGDNANVGCTVANGTGIFVEGSARSLEATLQNSTIETNSTGVSVPGAESGGAGLFVRNGATVLVQKNVFTGNGAADLNARGGAILIEQAGGLFLNNLIYNNFAGASGGGVAILNGNSTSLPVELVNNTIVANRTLQALTVVGGPTLRVDVDMEGGNSITLSNNIIAANDQRAAVTCGGVALNVTFENNDIFNPLGPTVAVTIGCDFLPGQNGNISTDPMFADAQFFQYRLTAQSPAIDAGNNGALQTASLVDGADVSTDLDGNPRVVNGRGVAGAATVDMGAYEFQSTAAPSSFTLASSLNPTSLGQSVTFTATIAVASGPATGTVSFADGGSSLGTVPLVAGVAQLSSAALAAGSHTITATFNPSGSPGSSTATLTQVVIGHPTTTTLTLTPTSGPAFSTINFSGRVTSTSGIPTGTVTFMAAGKMLATAAVQPDGTAQASLALLGAGAYSIVASYSGDAAFDQSTSSPASLVLSALPTVPTLTSSPNPAFAGQSVTFHASVPFASGTTAPTGSVTFTTGSLSLGTIPLDPTASASLSTAALPLGTLTITAAYSGDGNYLPGSATLQQVVTLIATATTLATSPNPSYLGQAVTLTSSSTAGQSPADGTISFYDGSLLLGSAPTAAGKATFATSGLSAGQHLLTATLGATGSNAGSTSAPVLQTVLPQSFGLVLSPAHITLASGKSGGTLVQLTSFGNFNGPLALSVQQLPPHSSGSFSSANVQLTAGTQASASFSLSTVDLGSGLQASILPRAQGRTTAFLALFVIPALLRKRRRLPAALTVLCFGAVLLTFTGCTDVGYPLATTAPGNYAVPITATDVHNISQTVILQLSITN